MQGEPGRRYADARTARRSLRSSSSWCCPSDRPSSLLLALPSWPPEPLGLTSSRVRGALRGEQPNFRTFPNFFQRTSRIAESPCGRGLFEELFGVCALEDGKDVPAVLLELAHTDTADRRQRTPVSRFRLGDRGQRRVGEDDECRHAGLAGHGQPPRAQPFERRLVIGRWARVTAARLALRRGGEL